MLQTFNALFTIFLHLHFRGNHFTRVAKFVLDFDCIKDNFSFNTCIYLHFLLLVPKNVWISVVKHLV
jgi:hypothetical protein